MYNYGGNPMNHRPKQQTVETGAQRVSEELYRAIFEQAADGIFIADRQGRYLEVNRARLRMPCTHLLC